MITMHVADEDSFELLKADVRSPQGQLSTFPRINQIRVTVDIY